MKGEGGKVKGRKVKEVKGQMFIGEVKVNSMG